MKKSFVIRLCGKNPSYYKEAGPAGPVFGATKPQTPRFTEIEAHALIRTFPDEEGVMCDVIPVPPKRGR